MSARHIADAGSERAVLSHARGLCEGRADAVAYRIRGIDPTTVGEEEIQRVARLQESVLGCDVTYFAEGYGLGLAEGGIMAPALAMVPFDGMGEADARLRARIAAAAQNGGPK